MSAFSALRRTSGKQLQLAGPWERGCLPATTVPGYASSAFSLLFHRSALLSPMPEKPGRRLKFVADVEPVSPDLYLAKERNLEKYRSS
jgi:hypothetical protein